MTVYETDDRASGPDDGLSRFPVRRTMQNDLMYEDPKWPDECWGRASDDTIVTWSEDSPEAKQVCKIDKVHVWAMEAATAGDLPEENRPTHYRCPGCGTIVDSALRLQCHLINVDEKVLTANLMGMLDVRCSQPGMSMLSNQVVGLMLCRI